MWRVDEDRLESIAIGAGILGTGGGGNPYYGKLHARRLLRSGAEVRVVEPRELPDDALVVSVGSMGAPTVGVERIPRGDECLVALRALERHVGREATHLIPSEIGGGNSTRPMVVAAMTGLPVIDADGMGRAFPELQMDTFSIYGVPSTPAALADVYHNVTLFPHLRDALTLERYARAVTVQMGGSAGYAFPAMSGADVKRAGIPMTLTLASRIGEAVRDRQGLSHRSGRGGHRGCRRPAAVRGEGDRRPAAHGGRLRSRHAGDRGTGRRPWRAARDRFSEREPDRSAQR
jgi:uncharacterized protein